MNQIELHNKIDEIIKAGVKTTTVDLVSELISINDDAKRYFFAVADEHWLDWLWKNGFLDAIKKKADDISKYSYRMPELDYLARMTEKDHEKVANIILDTPITKENFNPEVIDRFLWICSSLPAEQIVRLVEKIKKEEWVRLMYKFNRWGFDYEKMMKKLFEAGDYENMLILAEAILAVRTKEEIKEMDNGYNNDNPFYFDNLGHTKIFEYLVGVKEEFAEKALALVTVKMKEIIKLSDKRNDNKIFDIEENFYLFDVDFFELEIDSERHISFRDDVKNLAATIKKLAENIIGNKCNEPKKAKELYKKYINSLPFSRSMWRLRLYVLSLCPEAFKDELKTAFIKPLQYELHYHELLSGTEYYKALKKGFYVLSKEYKRKYIDDVINYFSKTIGDKDVEKWCKRDGLRILSCIESELNDKREEAEKNLNGKIDKDFKPEPSIGKMRGGTVHPKAPVDIVVLNKMSIAEIVKKLKSEWSPENLYKMDKDGDFLRPLNAEGMSELFKQDMKNRIDLYLDNANLFFNRDKLDSHYTYSFLRGLYDIFKQDKFKIEKTDKLFELFNNIADSGLKKEFEEERNRGEKFDAWLASWTGVHSAIADNLKVMLGENSESPFLDFKSNRNDLLKIIKYLLSHPNPKSEDNIKEHSNDPFATAINSVRGQAFEVLTLFIYLDGKKYQKEAEIKIDEDVKKIYEEILNKEDTFAVMFLFGYYLPSYYYRDRKWVMSLINKIFSKDENKKDLFLATLEGYLSANLYKELFEELQNLYKLTIEFKPEEYTKRKYFRELDKGLAIHLSLAFMYFDDFNFESDLFKLFWATPNQKRHQEFISFIGRHAISRDNGTKFIKENRINLEKLKKFWDWTLKEENIDSKSFAGFGYWINPNTEILDDNIMIEKIAQTLKKSNGDIDWDYGLLKRLKVFAEKDGEKTLEIISSYLLDSNNNLNQNRRAPLLYQAEIKEAMMIIYKNGNTATKQKVTDRINTLIKRGSSMFWELKEIIE